MEDRDSAEVNVGVRKAEDFEIVTDSKQKAQFQGTPQGTIEQFGKESKLIVGLEDIDSRLNFLHFNKYDFKVGDKINFNVPTNRLHIFDVVSENRIEYNMLNKFFREKKFKHK